MGQYHILVNVDKKEYVIPHDIGSGLKQWEQIHTEPSIQHAMYALMCCSNYRGGGDLGEDNDVVYTEIMGRWVGDRVLIVGDYGEDGDVPSIPNAGSLYGTAQDDPSWTNISPLVREFFTLEFGVQYIDVEKGGWLDWKIAKRSSDRPALSPDMTITG